jgi:hypothetical protein
MSVVRLLHKRDGNVLFPDVVQRAMFDPDWPPAFDPAVPIIVRNDAPSLVAIDMVVDRFPDEDFERIRDENQIAWFETGFRLLKIKEPGFAFFELLWD